MSVAFEISDGVANVRLNRPERLNAVDSRTESELAKIWQTIERSPEVRCVVLTGTGRAFCAGADMKEDGPSGMHYWAQAGNHGFGGIALAGRLSVPVVARVNGLAMGGGFEMVLGCDIAVAASGASFALPEPRVGRLPLDGMFTLPRMIPRSLALGILLTGRRVSAEQALEWGLVNQVVEEEDLDEAVGSWVNDILACAPLSLKAIKRSVYDTAYLSTADARDMRQEGVFAALQSDDAEEGVAAFREKRRPQWKGS